MVRVTRRQTLQLSASAILGGLTGCSALGGNSDPDARLGEIDVTNLDFRAHTVSVLILDDEEPVYSGEMTVSAAEPEADDSTDVATAGGSSFEGVPSSVEGCILYAWRDDQSPSKWSEFDFREQSASCLGLDIRVGDIQDPRSDEVTILHTTNTSVCETAANHTTS